MLGESPVREHAPRLPIAPQVECPGQRPQVVEENGHFGHRRSVGTTADPALLSSSNMHKMVIELPTGTGNGEADLTPAAVRSTPSREVMP